MKKILLVGLFCLSLSTIISCSSERKFIKEGISKKITLKNGSLLIKDSGLFDFSSKGMVFRGYLTNNSDTPIRKARFKISLLNELQVPIGEQYTFDSDFLKANETRALQIPFTNIENRERITDYKIDFVDALYYAKYQIELEKPKQNKNLVYEDQNINIAFAFEDPGFYSNIQFQLENKLDEPIEINWNKVSLIDLDNNSKKIIHLGVKFSEKEKDMTETVIPPQSKIKDLVSPIDKNYLENDKWVNEAFFPTYYTDDAKNLINKKIKVFMPIKINNKSVNYNFVFKISDVSY